MNKWLLIGAGGLVGGALGFLAGWKTEAYSNREDDAEEPEEEPEERTKWYNDVTAEKEPNVISSKKANVLKNLKTMSELRKKNYVEVEEDGERVIPGRSKPDLGEAVDYTAYSRKYASGDEVTDDQAARFARNVFGENDDEYEGVVIDEGLDTVKRWDFEYISHDEFLQTEPFFKKSVLAWYVVEKILADDNLDPVDPAFLDADVIRRAATEDVYIRVADQETDYEVIVVPNGYLEAKKELEADQDTGEE